MTQQVDGQGALIHLHRQDPAYASVVQEVVTDPEAVAEDQAILVQGRAEGLDLKKDPDRPGKLVREVTFCGKQFRIASKVGLMPLMEFAYYAKSGADTGDMDSLAAIYEMLRDCIDKDDWQNFTEHAKRMKADADEMLPVVQQTIELLTANPTVKGSGSSPSSRPTPATTTDSSSERRAPEGLIPVADLARAVSSG